MRRLLVLSILLALNVAIAGQQRFSTGTMPPPRFDDSDRVAKLKGALPEIERLFSEWLEKRHVPGAALGLIIDGELVWLKTAGVRNVETSDPVESDTLFRIASMSKSFTAMAILQLRDAGKLRLDDPVAMHVPELDALPYPTSDSPQITIRHLLNHAEGFPEDNPWGDRQLAQSDETLNEWLRAGIPFSNAPGTTFEYSNYGYALLGRIIAGVSGVPYDRYMRENILDPLDMDRSTFDIPAASFASGYRWEDEQWKPEPILAHGSFGAMGGLWTTAPELARYVSFLMSAFPPRDGDETGPVARSSAREMQQAWRSSGSTARPATLEGPLQLRDGAYGHGLGVSSDCRFESIVGHGGGLPGYGSYMQWLPEYGVGMIGMSNLTYTSPVSVINDAWDALRKTGALERRVMPPSPALLAAKARVSRIVGAWDDGVVQETVADNLFMDRSAERRRKELTELAERHGTCTPDDATEALNALRGQWRMNCERGWMKVAITLAPTSVPRVQHLEITSVMPPSAAMASLLESVMDLGRRWNDRGATRLLVPSADRVALRNQLEALSRWGRCRAGEAIAGNGTGESTIALRCERGAVDARLSRDETTGRLKNLVLVPARTQRCAP
jgi:CubicO group peptidase (beta-lactamase class C family)